MNTNIKLQSLITGIDLRTLVTEVSQASCHSYKNIRGTSVLSDFAVKHEY